MSTIQRQAASAVIDRIAARPYCTANSIPVVHWHDADNSSNVPNVVAVFCSPPGDIELERGPLWEMPVEVQVRTFRHDDRNRATLDGICGDVESFGRDCPQASLTAIMSGVQWDGLGVDAGVEVPDERRHMVSYTFTAHLQET